MCKQSQESLATLRKQEVVLGGLIIFILILEIADGN